MLMKRLSALWANDKLINTCTIWGNPEVLVSSVCIHSKNCQEASLFVATKGLHTDGHLYIKEAIELGATTIVHSSVIDSFVDGITYIKTDDIMLLASLFSYNLYGPYPSFIIGVTGTDGKSSTCEFLHSILTSIGLTCGLLSTTSIDTGLGKHPSPYRMSTPEVDILYPFLHECYLNGVDYVILEATSHGLSPRTARLTHITFSAAIISNITSEHLDFHLTQESYIDDKMNLVRQLCPNSPIIIQDTFTYRDTVESILENKSQLYTYAVESPSNEALIKASTVNVCMEERTLIIQKGEEEIEFPLPYAVGIYTNNFMASLTLASVVTNYPLKNLLGPSLKLGTIKGRFEIIYNQHDKIIINDFAHTKNGFFHLFSFLRIMYPQKRLIALFGAAGERDTSKRKELGEMAFTFCSIIYLTDEDSRGEDVRDIIEDIKKGFTHHTQKKVFEFIDRKEAVQKAISHMEPGDILLLLGKGHEKSIDHGSYKEAYDETETALEAIGRIH